MKRAIQFAVTLLFSIISAKDFMKAFYESVPNSWDQLFWIASGIFVVALVIDAVKD